MRLQPYVWIRGRRALDRDGCGTARNFPFRRCAYVPCVSMHMGHASACRRVEKSVSWHATLCVARWRLAKPRDACVAVNTSCDRLSRKCNAAWVACKSCVCKILKSVVGCAFALLGVYVGNSSVDSVNCSTQSLVVE